MYIQFLIEDISGKILIDAIMKKYIEESPANNVEYNILPYKGIGGFSKGKNVQNIKSQHLLNDLPKRLKAFNAYLLHKEDACLFIILDNDTRNPLEFRKKLENIACRESIKIDHVFCIAIEEMEAWLLGDYKAIQAAYPKMHDRIASKHSNYAQDSICGTWEFLADILTRGGIGQFKKQNPTVFDIGKCKSEWAENIGQYFDIRQNTSPSFQFFISNLDKRLAVAG